MKKEYKIILIVAISIVLMTTIFYSFFSSFEKTGLFTLPNNLSKTIYKINNSENPKFTTILDTIKLKQFSLPLIYGYIKDINGNKLVNVNIDLYYQYNENDNTYRIFMLNAKTNSNGYYYFNLVTLKNRLTSFLGSLPNQPYSIFLEVYKDGFMDKYIYDFDEKGKLLYDNSVWQVNVNLSELLETKKNVVGNLFVIYYPGQEYCASLAMNYMEEYYPKVQNILGIYNIDHNTGFIFETISKHGQNPWITTYDGIYGICDPWTDNINDSQIKQMWLEITPHEMVHNFLSFKVNDVSNTYLLPNWANEGLAYYVQNILNNIDINCNTNYLISLDNFVPGNMPQYHSAACSFKLLEQNNSGFIKEVIALDKTITLTNPWCTYKTIANLSSVNISGYYIKTILSQVYGSDLTDFFVDNFGFKKSDIDLGNTNVINYLNNCNEGD